MHMGLSRLPLSIIKRHPLCVVVEDEAYLMVLSDVRRRTESSVDGAAATGMLPSLRWRLQESVAY